MREMAEDDTQLAGNREQMPPSQGLQEDSQYTRAKETNSPSGLPEGKQPS